MPCLHHSHVSRQWRWKRPTKKLWIHQLLVYQVEEDILARVDVAEGADHEGQLLLEGHLDQVRQDWTVHLHGPRSRLRPRRQAPRHCVRRLGQSVPQIVGPHADGFLARERSRPCPPRLLLPAARCRSFRRHPRRCCCRLFQRCCRCPEFASARDGGQRPAVGHGEGAHLLRGHRRGCHRQVHRRIRHGPNALQPSMEVLLRHHRPEGRGL
mmetsp:Transcript_49695/g.133004  ORF Transcript_49695/g.133004 Transcript_49695/m.133004 type:complete len:211 (-) Transcript_49695:50-682(-)